MQLRSKGPSARTDSVALGETDVGLQRYGPVAKVVVDSHECDVVPSIQRDLVVGQVNELRIETPVVSLTGSPAVNEHPQSAASTGEHMVGRYHDPSSEARYRHARTYDDKLVINYVSERHSSTSGPPEPSRFWTQPVCSLALRGCHGSALPLRQARSSAARDIGNSRGMGVIQPILAEAPDNRKSRAHLPTLSSVLWRNTSNQPVQMPLRLAVPSPPYPPSTLNCRVNFTMKDRASVPLSTNRPPSGFSPSG